jgi:O-acetyl-ADP-ribose deacetylase (regulator of RNase III)
MANEWDDEGGGRGNDIDEIIGDVLSLAKTGASVVHCISSDCALGDGIARQLDVAYMIKRDLQELPPALLAVGNVIELRRVTEEGSMISIFNIVTKSSRMERPSYATLDLGLLRLRKLLDEYSEHGGREVSLIAMPRIGCGIDRLDWRKVHPMVVERFHGCKIPVKVCVLPEKGTE